MNDAAQKRFEDIIKMSYGYFTDKPCSPESLSDFISMMRATLNEFEISEEFMYSELERRHTVSILDSSFVLDDQSDHVDWFNPSTNAGLQRDVDWHFWSHYKDFLAVRKQWPSGVVDQLDHETSLILSRVEDPRRLGAWSRRGMIMGSVQSGKTANYTGLIAKAVDAGYKLIVVLAGVHNSLRSQTQYRINEELLGYDLDQVQQFQEQAARIGIREMFRDHRIIQTLTNSSDNGDFKKNIASQAGIVPSRDGDPTILIVKKHVSILRNLIEWSTAIIGEEDDSGRRVVPEVPLLVIDDECDYASVNTRSVVRDENGIVLEDCDPAKTNQRIRELLCAFRKSAYIGYTATPFANIFIHHDTRHPLFGEDLFPRNFIISLSRASNYIGPDRLFGLRQNWVTGEEEQDPLPLLRSIDDHDECIPDRHRKDLPITSLPSSMRRAIKSFLLAATLRCLRRVDPPHNSMLIHVTRFTNVQRQVGDLVERELRKLVGRLQNANDSLADFRELWEQDFKATSMALPEELKAPLPEWPKLKDALYPIARRVSVKLINGEAGDTLQYRVLDRQTRERIRSGEEVPWEERGEHVIAIGGDKLSRGLTLDGLSVSYYLRASRMYDTLMQMGRWFGYRDGYLDACRIYTTDELIGWYRHIAGASSELKHELEYMALLRQEPKDFGLKVLSHPGRLAVTSAGKMRSAETLSLSYSGRISETVVFDPSKSQSNLESLQSFLLSVNQRHDLIEAASSRNRHWRGVTPDIVCDFLRSYRTHEEAKRIVDPSRMADFIEMQIPQRELIEWDVVVVCKSSDPKRIVNLNGIEIGCITRSALHLDPERISIRRLISPSDEWLDMTDEDKRHIRDAWHARRQSAGLQVDANRMPSGTVIREFRPKERGLLLLYALCSDDESGRYGMDLGQETIGLAISFPSSDTARQIQYVANSVYQDSDE